MTKTNTNIKVTWYPGDLKRICQIQLKTKNENTTKTYNANETKANNTNTIKNLKSR